MSETNNQKSITRLLIGAASVVVILTGLKVASSLIVPFLLAGFIALVCSIPLFWLYRKGVPNALSVLIIVSVLLGLGTLLILTVGSSVKSFSTELPSYRANLESQLQNILTWLASHGVDTTAYEEQARNLFDPASALDLAGGVLKSISSMLTNSFMVLMTVVFILLETVAMPTKLKKVLEDPETTFKGFKTFTTSVKRYLVIKTLVSGATGILVGVWLAILGLDFPILWGFLAFVLNFIPTIGSIIAAIPAILIGVVQFGPEALLSVGACFLTVNIVMGNVLEPRVMGEGLGLSALVVFLSLVFWGWLLGPVGMLLSVPLTMIVKIACQSNETTRHIGILLGPSKVGKIKRISVSTATENK